MSDLVQVDHEGNKAGYVDNRPVVVDSSGERIQSYYCHKTRDFEVVIADGNISIKVYGRKA